MWILKVIGAILSIFALSSIIDWFFAGSKWVHKHYARVPEIWRQVSGQDAQKEEARVVRLTLFLTFEYSVVSVLFYRVLAPGVIFYEGWMRAVVVASALWLLVAVPILITQHLFIKYPRASTLAQLVAWYLKLLVAAFISTYVF